VIFSIKKFLFLFLIVSKKYINISISNNISLIVGIKNTTSITGNLFSINSSKM
jgi:hypothetical protein